MSLSTHAATAEWTLNRVTFIDGSTANGKFTIDTDLKTLTQWDINTTEDLTFGFLALNYDSSAVHNSSASGFGTSFPNDSFTLFITGSDAASFGLGFGYDQLLNPLSTTLAILGGGESQTRPGYANSRTISTGEIIRTGSTSAVPLPNSFTLMGLGLVALIWLNTKSKSQMIRYC